MIPHVILGGSIITISDICDHHFLKLPELYFSSFVNVLVLGFELDLIAEFY